MLGFSPLAMPAGNKVMVRIFALVLPLLFLLPVLSQTVLAQNTYVITDGTEVTVHKTYETDLDEVLDEAGIALGKGDTYIAKEADGVSEITVRRNQNITVYNCGTAVTLTSYGEALGALLQRCNIPTDGNYQVSLPLDTQTYDGMEVAVDCVITMEQTYTQVLPYETTYCYDPNMAEGTQKVMVEGTDGQVCKTANVTYINSQETEREVLTETVVQESVSRIVVVGTATQQTPVNPNAPAIGNGVIVTSEGEVLTYSHSDQFKTTAYTHTDEGCDMITATGTTVRWGTVAVDPKVIPYGTRMFIVSNDGQYIYGISTAEDCGGGVKGKHIDLYFPTDPECWTYGVRSATVYFLN